MLPRPTSIKEWGRIFTQVPIWEPAVRAIFANEGLPCCNIRAGYPGSNAVFLIDDSYVIKIFAPMFAGDYDKERRIQQLLTTLPAIKAPKLLASGHYDDGNPWPYLITTFCPGEALRDIRQQLDSKNLNNLAAHLGQMMRVLHETRLDELIAEGWTTLTWETFFQQRATDNIAALHSKQIISEELTEALRSMIEQAAPLFQNPALRLVHADLTQDHLLLTQDECSGEWLLSALIDFADSEIAPPEYEWIPLWFDLFDRNAGAFRSFLSAYDPNLVLDEAWENKMLAMTFLHRFGVIIVENTLAKLPTRPRTLSELREAFWPKTEERTL